MRVLGGADGNDGSMSAYIDYVPPNRTSLLASPTGGVYSIRVGIDYSPKPHNDHGATSDTLQLLASDKDLYLRLFTDRTVVEAYFQRGRVALTAGAVHGSRSRGQISFSGSGIEPLYVKNATAWSMQSIWVPADALAAK